MKSINKKYILVKTNEEEMKALLVLSYLGYRWRGRESMLKPLSTVSYKEAFIFMHVDNTLTYNNLSYGNRDYQSYELITLEDILKY